jgi:ABC-type transport system involved in cytochrome bd biosynthesis fused ATPase/permease subunit
MGVLLAPIVVAHWGAAMLIVLPIPVIALIAILILKSGKKFRAEKDFMTFAEKQFSDKT